MVRVIVHEGCLGEEVILRGICETGRFKLEVKVRELWMSRVVNQKSTSICNSVPNYELSRFFMLFHHSKSTVSVVNLEHRQVITLSIYLVYNTMGMMVVPLWQLRLVQNYCFLIFKI